MFAARVICMTSRIEVSGVTVIGSRITPASNFLTMRTSLACWAAGMFLWMMPMPPHWAIVMARRASVTVSIAAERIGMFRRIPRVSGVARLTSRGRNVRVGRNERDVVESKRFGEDAHRPHSSSVKAFDYTGRRGFVPE
jgi:hypothetical protein